MRVVIAIHDPPVWTIPPAEVRRIADALPHDDVVDARTAEAREVEIRRADVLFAAQVRALEVTGELPLKWLHSPAVGVGPVLVPELIGRDVLVTNSRGVHSEAIAEHAIALALAVRRQLHTAVRRQMSHEWAQQEILTCRAPLLSQSRLLVVGLGTIGARVAALGAGLGMQVTGIRRRRDQPLPAGVTNVWPSSKLTDALADADVIVLALPQTAETQNLIGAAEFSAMKTSAILVNVARGHLIDEAALIRALDRGQLAGAGLDAFQQEPLPRDHPLWDVPHVLISPHSAPFSRDYWPPVVDLFLENMARFTRGEALVNPVDKRAGY